MTRTTLIVNRLGAPSETFQRSLAAQLAAGGHQVTVHALRGTDHDPPAPPGIAHSTALAPASRPLALAAGVVRLPAGPVAEAVRRARARFGTGARGRLAAAVAAPILATRPDVIHVGFSGIGVAIADALELLDDIALVVSCRGTDELVWPLVDPGRRAPLAALYRRATVVHAVADAMAEAVVQLGADPEKVRVIRPAVDVDAWPRRRLEPPGDPARIVAVARLVAAKGVADLISALAVVVERGLDVQLRVVGDGPERDALCLRIHRAGLDDRVQLLGSLPPDEVRAELAGAQVFASASLAEGISNGVLEAMAVGVATVSTEVGGMAELVRSGETGWSVPPARPDALATALLEALGDPDERARRARSARALVEAEFGLDRQAAQWLAVYDELPGGDGEASEQTSGRGGDPR